VRRLGANGGKFGRTPTLAASLSNSAAALPPEGELFAPWGGSVALTIVVAIAQQPAPVKRGSGGVRR
jgi:hypothetical protein